MTLKYKVNLFLYKIHKTIHTFSMSHLSFRGWHEGGLKMNQTVRNNTKVSGVLK